MNTLHVDLGADWRGGQNQALLLLEGLRARGHGAELIAVEGAPLAERARRQNLVVHPVGKRARRARSLLRIRRLLSEKKFDLVHAHDAHSLTAAWLARAHIHTTLIASRRVAYPLQGSRLALARYRSARSVVAVSRFVADSAVTSGLESTQVEVVHDGIPLPELPTAAEKQQARTLWEITNDEILLGCVGYLLPEKGQEVLLHAFPRIAAQHPRCRLLLAGNGPMRHELTALARTLGIASQVIFAGFVEDVRQVYSALDYFLFPSLAEPLGSSLLDALAYGLPTVAASGGAVPEVLTNESNGLLAPPANPAELAAATIRLLGDSAMAHRFSVSARETIEKKFSVNHMVENTLRVYHQAVKQETPA